jgi:inhibitor of cysteine peptidase
MTRRSWVALVVLVTIGIGLLAAIVLVPWSDDAPAVSVPKVYHDGDDVEVKVGDEFVVALPANPSTGYAWTAADNPDVTYVSSHQVAGGSQPGAGGTQQLAFRADHDGDSTLQLAYARSFEPGVPPAKTAELSVSVTK